MSNRSNHVMPPRSEIEGMADLLARNARLDNPLSPNTDFSPEESREIQTQVSTHRNNPPPQDIHR